MKRLFLFIGFMTGMLVAGAQEDTALRRQLQGKTTLSEIMTAVNSYYNNPVTINRMGPAAATRYKKHWARYEWYWSNRLGVNGELVNINQKLFEATGISNRVNLTESHSGNWTPVGPMNTTNGIGRVDRLAFHPTDPDIVYAGTTAGGLWRTSDAGTTWTNLTPDIPSGGISGILIDPVNPNIIYILTGDGDSNIAGGLVRDFGYMRLSIGVLKSTNGGSTWTKMGDFPGVNYSTLLGYRLAINPANNNTIYACTNQGLFMSVNGGVSWGLVNGSGRFYNLKFRPGSGSICYATSANSTGGYLWKSVTGGISWDTVDAANAILNSPINRTEIAVSPHKPDLLAMLPGSTTGINGRFTGFYVSNDGGLSFDPKSTSPNVLSSRTAGDSSDQQSNYDLAIAISNTNSKNLVVGAVNIWSSADTGVNWTVRPDTHGDIHDLGYHPVNNKLWAATDGGVFSSTNNGSTWLNHFAGMNITQVYRMAVSPSNYLDMVAGTQDNAVKKRTNGSGSFEQIFCCDGFTVAYDATNSDSIYAVINSGISMTPDGGANINTITPNINNINIPFASSMATHTSLNGIVFLGNSRIFRRAAGTWNISSASPAGWFLRTCPSNGNRVYAAGGAQYNSNSGSMMRSDDGGTSWSLLGNEQGFPTNFTKITSINVDPTNSLRVWITLGGFTDGEKVYFCDYNDFPNGNWINRSGSIPNVPVNCIAIDNSNNAYLGTDNGVYYRGTNMNDWVPYYNNLPYVPVTDLVISEAQNTIRASTFGRGIWSSDLFNACNANITVSGTRSGQEFHEASNAVTSDASLVGSVGTRVQMRGGSEVLLGDGFHARENAEFKASIGPCNTGGANRQALVYQNRTGLVHIHAVSRENLDIEVSQTNNGEVSLAITDDKGELIRKIDMGSKPAGKWVNRLTMTGLAPGNYFLKLMLNNNLAHFQELILK